MPGPGGVPGLGEGGCLVPGGCLLLGGACSRGMPGPMGVPASGGVPGPGGCLLQGGACFGGVWYPACTEANPPPPVNRMTDRCKNITFATSLRRVKICIYLSHPFFLKNLSVFQIKIQKSKKNSVHNFVNIYVCVFRSKFS